MRKSPHLLSAKSTRVLAAIMLGLLSLHLSAQTTDPDTPGSSDAPTPIDLEFEQAGKIDWGEEILKGEEVSYILIFVAVAGLAYFLERIYSVRRSRFVSPKRAEALLRIWQRGDFQAAQRQAKKDSSIFGRAAEYIAGHTHLSFEIVSFTASDIVSRAVGRQLQRTYPLAIVATVSPLLGLLGTIIGMIEAFQKVAIMGDTGDASVLADSIGKALITTAVGLVVAIPALSSYHYFKMKINNLGIRIEEEVDAMLALWLTPEIAEEPEMEEEAEQAHSSAGENTEPRTQAQE